VALWQQTADGVRLRVRVQPRSSHNRVVGVYGDAVKLQVTAPPVEGAANAAVADVLAEWLGVPRRSVTIMHGHGGRDKVVMIATRAAQELGLRVDDGVARLRVRDAGRSAVVDKPTRCD
jgi:uncharacterized protein